MRRVLAILVVIAILPLGYYVYANPEKRTLDAAARAEAPGSFVTLDAGVTH